MTTILFFKRNDYLNTVDATTIEGELVFRWPLSDKRCFTKHILQRDAGITLGEFDQGGVVIDVELSKFRKLPEPYRPLRSKGRTPLQVIKDFITRVFRA